MSRFQKAINHLHLRELNLLGKKFTWSNNQSSPTMSRIDKAFYIVAWENLYDKTTLQALSSSSSDHCPLLVFPFILPYVRLKFRFESYWIQIPEFREVVQESWSRDTPHNLNHMMTLHIKLARVAKDLKSWSKTLIPQTKLAMEVCREVILQLETAQEARTLSMQN
jgi:hypothetical protein